MNKYNRNFKSIKIKYYLWTRQVLSTEHTSINLVTHNDRLSWLWFSNEFTLH